MKTWILPFFNYHARGTHHGIGIWLTMLVVAGSYANYTRFAFADESVPQSVPRDNAGGGEPKTQVAQNPSGGSNGGAGQQGAPAGSSTTEAAGIPLIGDYFQFENKVEHFKAVEGGPEVTAPKSACFRITKDKAKNGNPSTIPVQGTFVTGWFPHFLLPPYKCLEAAELKKSQIDPDLAYTVPKNMIETDRDRLRYGWTYGVLAAPFKYYPGQHMFEAGATVGPYLGYRVRDRPGETSVVAFAFGLTSANVVKDNPDGSTSNTERTGISTAIAFIVGLKGTFNAGFLAGTDTFSKSDNIPNSGKVWVGLSFGYMLDDK